MKMRSWNKMAVAALAAVGLFVALAGYTDGMQAAGTNTTAPTAVIAPAQVNLPPVPAEVLRMSEAGMSDDVITGYLQKSAYPYTLDAGQIIYLHDMGVSSAVLDALVTHGGMAANDQATAANEAANTDNVSPTATTAGERRRDKLLQFAGAVWNLGERAELRLVLAADGRGGGSRLAAVLQQRLLAVDGPGLVLELLLLVGLGAVPLRPMVPVSGLRLAVVSR